MFFNDESVRDGIHISRTGISTPDRTKAGAHEAARMPAKNLRRWIMLRHLSHAGQPLVEPTRVHGTAW
jgi:hypothetical protein